MNVPKLPFPPTDNLYKFMAISGVVLLIVAPVFWAQFYITHAERTRLALRALRIDISPEDEYWHAKARIERGKSATDEQRKLVEKYDAQQEEHSRVSSEFLVYEGFSYVVTGVAIALGLLGVVLTPLGFWLWYQRVQKPLDRILAKQLKKSDKHST
jgi:Flp pilus assembly protein TadB